MGRDRQPVRDVDRRRPRPPAQIGRSIQERERYWVRLGVDHRDDEVEVVGAHPLEDASAEAAVDLQGDVRMLPGVLGDHALQESDGIVARQADAQHARNASRG